MRLRSDFSAWVALLHRMWSDHIDPAGPFGIHIVFPASSCLELGLAAHLILIRDSSDALVASLVIWSDLFELSELQHYLRRTVTMH